METMILANVVIFFIASFIGILIGLNPKKWVSWVLGIYGFLSGSLVGFVGEGSSPNWLVGAIFAFLVMYIGTMNYWQKQHYKEKASSWLLQYGKVDRQPFALLACILKKIFASNPEDKSE